MSSKKVMGFLKGFKYISQIFENEKEEEIQIGNPTDVKHVAHIGWDGPSVNTPSWMNEFKSSPVQAAPLDLNEELQPIEQDNSVKWVSQVSKRGSRHVNTKGTKMSTSNISDSSTKEKANKTRQVRKSSKLKDSLNESNPTQQIIQLDVLQGNDGSQANNLLDIPKKSRRKKLKENSDFGESSKLRSKGQHVGLESPSEFVSKPRNKQRFIEESAQYERGVSRIS